MKNLSNTVSVTLSFYYSYVEYIRAIVNGEKISKIGWKHYLAIMCNYGYRPKAYEKVHEVAQKHFPKLFIIVWWKKLILELLGIDSENYFPSLKSLANFVRTESKEKREEFFNDLYAIEL